MLIRSINKGWLVRRSDRTTGQDQKEEPVIYDEGDLLTVREVAKQLRVDDTTVRRWIKNGVLEAITLPHRGARQAYRIRRSTLENLLAPPTQSTETENE